jgi:hypothetical protein
MIWISIVGWSAFNLQLLYVVFRASSSESEPVNFRAASS